MDRIMQQTISAWVLRKRVPDASGVKEQVMDFHAAKGLQFEVLVHLRIDMAGVQRLEFARRKLRMPVRPRETFGQDEASGVANLSLNEP
jgi:hypothetical protein